MVTFDLPDPDLEHVGQGGDGAMTVTVNRGRVLRVEIDRRALREGLLEVAPSFLQATNEALDAERDAYLHGSWLASATVPDLAASMGPAMLAYAELMSTQQKLHSLFRDAALDAADLADFNHELMAYQRDPIARQGAPFTRAVPALRSAPKTLVPRSWEPAPSRFAEVPAGTHRAPVDRDDFAAWEAIAVHRQGRRDG